MTYYKLARPDGWDFYSGKTINYRDSIGGVATAPDWERTKECGQGIHICANPNDCFVGAKIPCSAYEVEPFGRGKIAIDAKKSKAKSVRVLREIDDLDALFGWKYREATDPINPFRIPTPPITPDVLELLKEWASVRDSVRASVRDSVWDSVWESVWASMGASVGTSVRDSVWDSMGTSVWDSAWAYFGSLFPNIKDWKYVTHKPGEYPFASGVTLWRMGLVTSFDGKVWRLHAGPDGKAIWEGKA